MAIELRAADELRTALATLRAAGWYCEHDCGGVYRWRFDHADGGVALATDETCGPDLSCGAIFVGVYASDAAIATADYREGTDYADVAAFVDTVARGAP
ncbi:MAG: hypothetical protein AB7S26_29120 [Sandaracinaceae bacterium]